MNRLMLLKLLDRSRTPRAGRDAPQLRLCARTAASRRGGPMIFHRLRAAGHKLLIAVSVGLTPLIATGPVTAQMAGHSDEQTADGTRPAIATALVRAAPTIAQIAIAGVTRTAGLAGREPLGPIGRPSPPLFEQDPTGFLFGDPPPALIGQDPADSLYTAARTRLNQGDYRVAADLFRQVRTRFPRSAHTPDALYWEAFALYRVGGTDDLRAALIALQLQGEQYPQANTRADADALGIRLRGELARRGDAQAAEGLTEEAVQIAESCPQEDDDLRIAALNALLQMDADRALPILEQVLARRDACSAQLREKAVFLVSQKGSSEATDILLRTARSDPSVQVRRQAVFWLSQVDSERAVAALEEILHGSGDAEVRERALFALSQHDSERAAEVLRSYAQQTDAPAALREKAIFGLGQQGTRANAAFLRDLYGRLANAELRERIFFSISQMDLQESGQWLLDVALNADEPVDMRKKALFWAGQSDVPIGRLTNLYDEMPGGEMKQQLIFVYSQRDESAAVDKLIDIARNEPDTELRKKALFWLSQSDDPRVVEVLMEIINRE